MGRTSHATPSNQTLKMQNEERKGCLSGIIPTLGYLCMLSIMLFIGLWWKDDFIAMLITGLFFWIWIPLGVGAVITFGLSMSLKTRHHKILLGLGIFNLLFLAAYFLYESPQQDCSADIMAEHYERTKQGLRELEDYAREALDTGAYIHLEFDGKHISIFHVKAHNDSIGSSNWDADNRKDSLQAVVGLTTDELNGLRKRLSDLGCISVELQQDAPGITIGFRRVGLGMYFFRLYDHPLSTQQWQSAMDDEALVPYDRYTVFEYGAGAIGSMTFPGKDDYLQRKGKGPRQHSSEVLSP